MTDKLSKPLSKSSTARTKGSLLNGSHSVIVRGGEMGEIIRGKDWSKTPLGPIESWPECLTVSVNLMLNASIPICIWWGKKELITLYNDAYGKILGKAHPKKLGYSATKVLAEHWQQLKPLVTQVLDSGEPVFQKNVKFLVNRYGHEEEAYFSFSYSPLVAADGSTAGIFCALIDTTEEITHQQEIKESEKRFRNLADTAPMYIAMADANGNAVYFNKPWLEFTGKNIEEMKGMGWLSTLHPEDAPKFEKDFKNAFQEQIPVNKEYRFRRADGEYRWMLAIGAPRFTPEGRFIGYYGTYTDFHDLKQAQIALQASEERFRTLIEKSADAVQLVSPEGKILFSSDSIKNVLGYTPEELADAGVLPFLHPDDKDYFFDKFNKLLKKPGSQITMQYRVRHKDGTWAWLETVGANHLNTPNINALVGNFRNITKQKNAEDKLRRSEERFRALVDNIPNLAWMARADGYINWYNNRWYEYTGTTSQDMEGWGWQSVHDPKYLDKVVREWRHSIDSGETFEMVFPLKGKDGTFRPFLTRVVPLVNDKNEIEQWIGTNTDISEQMKVKKAQARTQELEDVARKLAKQRRELLELNKAKDDFISLASHQLRTPATAVKQYLGMLMEGYAEKLNDEQMAFAKTAFESNEREINVIDDLLKVAQVDAGHMQLLKTSVDIVALVNDILSGYSGTFRERKQKVTVKHHSPSMILDIDKERIRMVLENIIDNGSKYTPSGKTIAVSTKQLTSGWFNIVISDEGVGMDDAAIDRIFDKFVRVDNPLSVLVGGTGLGLYLVKKIVDLHTGKIKVQSKPGKGSTFTISLPSHQVQ